MVPMLGTMLRQRKPLLPSDLCHLREDGTIVPRVRAPSSANGTDPGQPGSTRAPTKRLLGSYGAGSGTRRAHGVEALARPRHAGYD